MVRALLVPILILYEISYLKHDKFPLISLNIILYLIKYNFIFDYHVINFEILKHSEMSSLLQQYEINGIQYYNLNIFSPNFFISNK